MKRTIEIRFIIYHRDWHEKKVISRNMTLLFFCQRGIYRVFKKKGDKVLVYYTTKKYISGAVKGFIVTTSTWHLLIYIKVFKYFMLKLILRHLNLDGNMADLGHLGICWLLCSNKTPTFGSFDAPKPTKMFYWGQLVV